LSRLARGRGRVRVGERRWAGLVRGEGESAGGRAEGVVEEGHVDGGGAATLGDRLSLWNRIASVLPLLALVAGLVLIHTAQSDRRASELAEVDAALLTDDLPPAAYADPGLVQFPKSSGPELAPPPDPVPRAARTSSSVSAPDRPTNPATGPSGRPQRCRTSSRCARNPGW